MINVFKATCYALLFATYIYLTRNHVRNICRQCNTFFFTKYWQTEAYVYQPVNYHWFYKKKVKRRSIWQPFSRIDSLALEKAFASSHRTIIPTDGGRFDVDISTRKRYSVYWTSPPTDIRRSSWFYKRSNDNNYIPFEEDAAMMLEYEFQAAVETKQWYRKVFLKNGNVVQLYQPNILVHYTFGQGMEDTWGETFRDECKPGVVKRGTDDFVIAEGEPAQIDHLLLIVHGIGSACDLKLRTIEEVVDEFRETCNKLLQSHFALACNSKTVHRTEILPINWHVKLHSGATGIDEKLKRITLPSVPRLRDFINNTLSDIFLYKSPKYCQTILTTVGSELNRIYGLFKKRNPRFGGDIFLSGHSLGSVILFDLLCHQKPKPGRNHVLTEDNRRSIFMYSLRDQPSLTPRISSMMLKAGIRQTKLEYPKLKFHPSALFSLGSPTALFVTTSGLDKLGCDFMLPTCPAFFNIFHPYDPIANRIETLVNPKTKQLKPALLPHHNGGKRIHLQIKDIVSRVTANIKEKLTKSMKNTRNKLLQTRMRYFSGESGRFVLNQDVSVGQNLLPRKKYIKAHCPDTSFGLLNRGRRIDYVLQEAPIESFNEYLFALTLSSHLCYWGSKDTMLLMLKEIYGSMDICSDVQLRDETTIDESDKIRSPNDDPDPDVKPAGCWNINYTRSIEAALD